MSLYQEWTKKSEDTTDMGQYQSYMKEYYELEQSAYKQILQAYPENDKLLNGKLGELAQALGFGKKLDIFTGFLEGMNTSLETSLELENIDENTEISLKPDYRKLLYNMHAAKANWLFKLEAWNNVLSAEEIEDIGKNYRRENIAVSSKTGRNEPCPCGSGKKYKNCCVKKSE